jgi:antitoxin (DNA-binding transcriptional repressor) of toxin-antitoxin stability system
LVKTLDIADVSRLPEELKSGEEIELRENGRIVAKVLPVEQQTPEERIDELARQGKVRKGTGTLPDDFFTRPLPKAESSILEQLLEDRRTGR